MPDPHDDPFRHHPELRDQIVEPLSSRYRNLDLLAIREAVAAAGTPPGWRRTDAEREALRSATLAGRRDRDLWVFAYGSLMWDPGFRFAEVRSALLPGYHRSFCLRSQIGRGSPDRPGLMAALDEGGECHGLAFRISADTLEEESEVLWKREMFGHAYDPRFLPLVTAGGEIEGLCFVIDPAADHYCPNLDIEEQARLIATGEGFYGRNIAYLENVAAHFDLLGIVDDAVIRLLERARAIAAHEASRADPTGAPT